MLSINPLRRALHILKVIWFGILCLFTLGVLFDSVAEASHFRGGTMSATVDATGVVTVTAETRWRKGGTVGSEFPLGGITRVGSFGPGLDITFQVLDGNTRGVLVTSFPDTDPKFNSALQIDIVGTTVSTDFSDPNFDIRRQVFTVDLPALGLGTGTYILYWTDAARIAGINNVTGGPFVGGNTPFSLECKIIYDGTDRVTPSLSTQVNTTVAKGQLYSDNLNASGTGFLTYSFIVGSTSPRYGPTFNVPGITVDATGQIEIPPLSTAVLNENNLAGQPAGDYVFKAVITDPDGQYIEQDVLLDVVDTPNQVCFITASDPAPTVLVGQTLNLTISASDPDPLDNLTVTAFPSVANSILTQTTFGNNASATYSFTPDASQLGTLGVNFTATDDGSPALSCVLNVQITVTMSKVFGLNFVVNTTVSGIPLHWPDGNATLEGNASYVISNSVPEDFVSAIQDAFETWDDLDQLKYKRKRKGSIPDNWGGPPDGLNNNVWIAANWEGITGADENTIAITRVRYNAITGEMTDVDIAYNDQDFDWSNPTPESGDMDPQNVATHEAGHVSGLGDIFNPGNPGYVSQMGDGNELQTMYGLIAEEEIDKRTLNSGDIAGIEYIYDLSNLSIGQQVIFLETGSTEDLEGLPEPGLRWQGAVDAGISIIEPGLRWQGSDLDLTLEDPDGILIDPAVAAINPDIDFFSGATFEFYRIQNPKPGVWSLFVFGADLPEDPELYTVYILAYYQY